MQFPSWWQSLFAKTTARINSSRTRRGRAFLPYPNALEDRIAPGLITTFADFVRRLVPQTRPPKRPVRRVSVFEHLEERVLLALGPALVADINVETGARSSEPVEFTDVNGVLFFVASTLDKGSELWKTDGTAAGTVLVKDIYPGPEESFPRNLVNVDGTLFFRASDPAGGSELWKSDGTVAGTVRVKDIRPGSSGSYAYDLTAVNGKVFFIANDGSTGTELWMSDGTEAGTVQVKDIYPGSSGAFPRNLTAVGSTLLFVANDPAGGTELWKTNGTAAGTVQVKDIVAGTTGSFPQDLTNVNGTLYFTAITSAAGQEIWKSNGTSAGTVQVSDIIPGPNSVGPSQLTNLNGTLVFTTKFSVDGYDGGELWKSDGTTGGTVRVKDILVGPSSSYYPQWLTVSNGLLYFTANTGVGSNELWRSDGSTAGTLVVKHFSGGHEAEPAFLTDVNGTLYFQADDGLGLELYKSNGAANNTVLVADVRSGTTGADPRWLTSFNGAVYFAANDGTQGIELWKSTGTAAGTAQVKNIETGNNGSTPRELTNVNGKVYFVAHATGNGRPDNDNEDRTGNAELWKSDGTAGGTVKLTNLNAGPASLDDAQLTNVDGVLYFASHDDVAGHRLWKTNGTLGGTVVVATLPGAPQELTNVAGTLFFSLADDIYGRKLWKSNGTAAGTGLVQDITYGPASSAPLELTPIAGGFYFVASDSYSNATLWKSDTSGSSQYVMTFQNPNYYDATSVRDSLLVNGTLYLLVSYGFSGHVELWKSDGTSGGTVPVKNFDSSLWYNFGEMTAHNGSVYFAADDGVQGIELWKSDGISAGTVQVKNIASVGSSNPKNLTSHGGSLYFTAFAPESGIELWKSDGTTAGTVLVKDLVPGGDGSYVDDMVSVGGVLYFSADSGNGVELWKSDGTSAGTVQFPDIFAGPGHALATELADVNGRLFFSAQTYATGRELWTLAETNVAPTNLALSSTVVGEDQPVNTVIGVFTTTDANSGDTFTYTLVGGTGSADNGSFNILNGQLRASAVFDHAVKSQYQIRVRTTDQDAQFFEKAFTITVTSLGTAPTDIGLTVSSITEYRPSGAIVGLFSTIDADSDDTFIYTLVAGTGSSDNLSFSIDHGQLRTTQSFVAATKSSYSIRVRSTDHAGFSVDKQFTITVIPATPTGYVLLCDDGVLHIEGTHGPDHITIQQISSPNQIQVFVGVGATQQLLGAFDLATVTQIEVVAREGNDDIWIGNGNQSLDRVLRIVASDGHDVLHTNGRTFNTGLADGVRTTVAGFGTVYTLGQDNWLARNGARTWNNTQDVTLLPNGQLIRMANWGVLQRLEAGTTWLDVTPASVGLSLVESPLIDDIQEQLDGKIVAYDFHSYGLLTLNIMQHTYYADIDLGLGAKLDTTKLQEFVKGQATLPQVDPIKAIAAPFNREQPSNEYDEIRDSFYAGIQGGANSVFLTSERFANWASPQKIVELGVKAYFGGAYGTQAAINEIISTFVLEFWDMAAWATRKFASNLTGLDGLVVGLDELARSLQHSFYWIPIEYREGGASISHLALAIQTTDPDAGSLDANPDYFSNPFDISAISDVAGGAASQAIKDVFLTYVGILADKLSLSDSLIAGLKSAAIDTVIYQTLLHATGINYAAVHNAQIAQEGTHLVNLLGTDIEDNIVEFLNSLGRDGKLAPGNEGSLAIDKLEYDTSTNSLVVKFDIHSRHVWPSASEMGQDLYEKGKLEVDKIVDKAKDIGEDLLEIADDLADGIGDAAKGMVDALRKLGLIPWENLSLTIENGQLKLNGKGTLPLIGQVELVGYISTGGNYSFSGSVTGKSLGIVTFPSLAVTLSNAGVHVKGEAPIPVLGKAELEGDIQSNGQFLLKAKLLTSWKLAGLSSNSFTNFKADVSNAGVNVSGTVSLPAGLGTGEFSGVINNNGTYAFGVTLGSSWNFGGIAKNAFTNFKVTLSNNGVGVSGSIALPAGLGSGVFSGTISSNGTFSIAVSLGTSWKFGGLPKGSFTNFQVKLTNNGIGVLGTVSLPAGLGSGTFNGTVKSDGTYNIGVSLNTSGRLAGLSTSAFSNFKVTLNNSGVGVSGNVTLPGSLGKGNFAGTIGSDGKYSITVALGTSWSLGGLSSGSFSNFSAKLSNSGIGISGNVSLPAGLGKGTFSGTVSSSGSFNVTVSLGSNWSLGGLSKSAYSNFKVTLRNSGISISGTVGLPGGLGSGTFSGTVSASGSFSVTVYLGSGRKLAGLNASSFSSLYVTLSQNGIAVSGRVSVGPIGGSFSGTVGSGGTYSIAVSLDSTPKIGISTLNATVRLTNSGMTFSGKLKLPYVNTSYTAKGTITNSGRYSFNNVSGTFGSSPSASELVRLWKGLGAGFNNIATALWRGGGMAGKTTVDLARALVNGANASASNVVNGLEAAGISLFGIAKGLAGSISLTLKQIADYVWTYTNATWAEVADAIWNGGVASFFSGGVNSTNLIFALDGAGAGFNDIVAGLRKAIGWTQQRALSALASLGFGGGGGGGSGGFIGQTLDRWGVNGYLEESTAFFDANKNGGLDAIEPWTYTTIAGQFSLPVPEIFDTNGNGTLEDSEGQWVILGGIDVSTGLPAAMTLVAPASWLSITPLSTLVSTLAANHSLTIVQATSQVLLAMGLPALDLSDFDPFVETLAGNANGPKVFAAHALVPDTVVQIAALFTGAGDTHSTAELTRKIVDAIAACVSSATAKIDLGSDSVIASLIQDVGSRLSHPLPSELVSGAATVIAATNREVTEVPVATTLAYLEEVSKIKHVAQGAVAQALFSAASGQTTIASVIVGNTGTVLDAQILAVNTAPIFAPTAPIQAEATGANGAVVNFALDAHDFAGRPVNVTYSKATGTTFPIGVTDVTATATDALGNVSVTTFTVTIFDGTPPALTLTDLIVEATGADGSFVTLPNVSAVDLVDLHPIVSYDYASGLFPLGETLVTTTVIDATGNSTTVEFLVIVVDTTNPVLATPNNITVEATDENGAVVTLPNFTATDLIDSSPEITTDHASGVFPIGTTVVSVAASDDSGNTTVVTFNVIVRDTVAPQMIVPGPITVEASVTGGFSSEDLGITATDLITTDPPITFNLNVIPLGTTLVTATATDAAGNSTSSSFFVTVIDTTPPEIAIPTDLIIEADVPGGANVILPAVPVIDLADSEPTVSYDKDSGFFPLGTTAVTATASDASGNTTQFTILITVVDTTAPVIAPISNITVQTTNGGGAILSLPAIVATDVADPSLVTWYDLDTDFFSIGTTLMTATATDTAGNLSHRTFHVTVIDSVDGPDVVPGITNVGSGHVEGSPVTVTGQALLSDTLALATGVTFQWFAYEGDSLIPFAQTMGVDLTQFTFTPSDNGTVRLTLTVIDQQEQPATTAAFVTVGNLPPQVGLSYTVSGTSTRNVQLTALATDPGASDNVPSLTYAWQVTRNGTAFANGTSQSNFFSFNTSQDGAYAVSLLVTDKDGGVGVFEQTISTMIPVAASASATTTEDEFLDGQLAATDSDGTALTYLLVGPPTNGTVTIASDGSYHYVPNANYFGTDQFTYRANDGHDSSNLATLSITITPVNDGPVAATTTDQTAEDTPLAGSLPGTDVDSSPLTYTLVEGASRGTIVVNSNGTYLYTPELNFYGEDQFTFQVSDGQLVSSATLLIVVHPVNDVPIGENDDVEGEEDSPINGSVSANDDESDTVTYSVVQGPAYGSVTLSPVTGVYVYEPLPNFHGIDSFTFRSSDASSGGPATVSITVNAINDPPVAQDSTLTTSRNSVVTSTAIATDIDENSLTYRIVSNPLYGSVTIDSVTGHFQYTPAFDYVGGDSFQFRVNDGVSDSASATVQITVGAISLDIDGSDGMPNGFTDGALIFGYLTGLNNAQLANFVAGNAIRTLTEIRTYLDELKAGSVLDIDGSGGSPDGFTDGALVFGYLTGLNNAQLANFVAANATRTITQIRAYLDQLTGKVTGPSSPSQPSSISILQQSPSEPDTLESVTATNLAGGRVVEPGIVRISDDVQQSNSQASASEKKWQRRGQGRGNRNRTATANEVKPSKGSMALRNVHKTNQSPRLQRNR